MSEPWTCRFVYVFCDAIGAATMHTILLLQDHMFTITKFSKQKLSLTYDYLAVVNLAIS